MNLVELFGFPEFVRCPSCKNQMESGFKSYDIESSWTFDKGHFNLHIYCAECEGEGLSCEFEWQGQLEIKFKGIKTII